MAVFYKLCRIAPSSTVHITESVSVMGHARSTAVCSTKWDQKQRNIIVHISLLRSEVLPDWHTCCRAEMNSVDRYSLDTGVHISAR